MREQIVPQLLFVRTPQFALGRLENILDVGLESLLKFVEHLHGRVNGPYEVPIVHAKEC